MNIGAFSILLAAGATLVSAAHAQAPPADQTPAGPPASAYGVYGTVASVDLGSAQPQWDGDAWRNIPGPPIAAARGPSRGVEALKDRKYSMAEKIFADFLERKPDNADVNLYMGVAKMNLGKWEDAKEYLEVAARQKPDHPDPKSRLGVTYAKLGDEAGATAQRAELVRMGIACKSACRLSPYIVRGIEMIDEALAQPASSAP